MNKQAIEKALDKAFQFGTRAASGYISGLASMGSRRTLGEGDDEAYKIRKQWPETREKLLQELSTTPDGPS